MNNKTVSFIKDTVFTLTSVIPIAVSISVCSGMGVFAGAVFACIAALILPAVEPKKQTPVYISLLIITYTFSAFGASTVSLGVIICGLLLIIASCFTGKIKKKININNPAVSSALMLSGALTVTILFTTDYFGIGASGNTVKEIIASYLSLGFHPNWRGVLYGTIVMVVMITFPRKFKKGCKTIDAAFSALIITTGLNLLLNPSDMISAIHETGILSPDEYLNNIILPLRNSAPSYLNAILSGLALFISSFNMIIQTDDYKKSDLIISGAANCITGLCTCMPIPCGLRKDKYTVGLVSSVLTAAFFFVFNDLIARIPVHSCAVMLIVGAWQSVKWGEIKKVFINLPFSPIIFVAVIALSLLFGIVNGIIISAIISIIYHITEGKTVKGS